MSGNDLVLSYLPADARDALFDTFWSKLNASASIDLDALKACVRLLAPDHQVNSHDVNFARIVNYVHDALPKQSDDPERLYVLAEICSSNSLLGQRIFQRLHASLDDIRSILNKASSSSSLLDQHPETLPCLRLLKSSYWLPPDQPHYISGPLILLLLDFLGHDEVDGLAHDTLSALLSLLEKPTTIYHPDDGQWAPCLISNLHTKDTIIPSQQLWVRLKDLPSSYFSTESGRVFKTWFQWISYATSNQVELTAIYDPDYWTMLRIGLLSGFSEQRKFCLGILRQSLRLSRRDIHIPLMELKIEMLAEYSAQYESFSSLFETIVLDRYPNQIQACLPGLTALFGASSLVRIGWTTALLSGVLHPTVQDGARKIVGNWYMNFVTSQKGPLEEHADFFLEGFLPWATQGTLFSHSLTSTRSGTICAHGQALASSISIMIQAMPTAVDRQSLLVKILQFILDAGGRMFHYAIIYLLEGLNNALEAHSSEPEYVKMGAEELRLIFQVARLPGLPEIATELCFTYCSLLSVNCMASGDEGNLEEAPGYRELSAKHRSIIETRNKLSDKDDIPRTYMASSLDGLSHFLERLEKTQHKAIQDENFAPQCDAVSALLDITDLDPRHRSTVYRILEALWEEADRQEFRRQVVVKLPPLFFHPKCIDICITEQAQHPKQSTEGTVTSLLARAMEQLHQFSEGRSYLLSTFVDSIRKASVVSPRIISILPFKEFLVRFISSPPLPKREFLFEVAAAEKLKLYNPRQTYEAYYGKRDWHAYACVIDLLARFPPDQIETAKQVLKQILEPWRTQKRPIPIISKWKESFQLQAMLLLTDSCIDEANAPWYLDAFMQVLILEQWPRYRYLLEWIISRVYYRFPQLAERILPDLENLDDTVPVQIASLMKLAVLATPFLNSEQFTLRLITLLIPFSANPKIHIRHEAHWSFPIVYGVAEQRDWTTITSNPAFTALNKYIRSLDKFNSPASTIRTLHLDAINDFTLVKIFQGAYLTIESPERQFVAHEDFEDLWAQDTSSNLDKHPSKIPLGAPNPTKSALPLIPASSKSMVSADSSTPAPLQTKSGFNLASLLPAPGPPSASKTRPTSVLLIASLIDNPTNLGGLSRISESFGLEALYINDIKCLGSKDFQSTAVTSHKHLPIKELKIASVPEFLRWIKREGYVVVGVEQTDRSGILGDEPGTATGDVEVVGSGGKRDGTLPKKCALVLGSEKGGITAEVLAAVDRCVEIRTVGVTRSLNVQTAGGIAVYEWWREWGGK